jgi:hypothetical protein
MWWVCDFFIFNLHFYILLFTLSRVTLSHLSYPLNALILFKDDDKVISLIAFYHIYVRSF